MTCRRINLRSVCSRLHPDLVARARVISLAFRVFTSTLSFVSPFDAVRIQRDAVCCDGNRAHRQTQSHIFDKDVPSLIHPRSRRV